MPLDVRPAGQPETEPHGGSRLAPLSIVVPTFNRGDLLVETLEAVARTAEGLEHEFVIIDDGSSDHTPALLADLAGRLPNLTWKSIPNGGPGQARNLGAAMARHPVVLFLGDDIQPLNGDFLRAHAELHAANPDPGFAVLGKVVWPDRPDADVNFVMAHIQGKGGEQFGYADFTPFTMLDFRFFYTCNISVKRNVVTDWQRDGFSDAYTLAAFEDIEFAYRMSKRPHGMKIFYTPISCGTHHHPYTVAGFMGRQANCGAMAKVFVDQHPEVAELIGLGPLVRALESPPDGDDDRDLADLMSVAEGLKAWARLLEAEHRIGSQHWHDDVVRGVFELAYLQAFIGARATAQANLTQAYRLILERFSRHVQRSLRAEIIGDVLPVARALPWMAHRFL
ncbi:glycosyltransferase family 2 protein [Azospirillum halopraeferens]|uniref:glycosyltransferase family 2 protein n=1 Tax=Azospirillum halopraeferens TaxID=34010 RepID=UPI00041C67C3|nr:glycosyltransferase [Azospirillum halopraeferens]